MKLNAYEYPRMPGYYAYVVDGKLIASGSEPVTDARDLGYNSVTIMRANGKMATVDVMPLAA